jgi:hypothetical protein
LEIVSTCKVNSKKEKKWSEFYESSLCWPIVMQCTRFTYNVRCRLKEITRTPGLSSGFFRSMLLTSPRLKTSTGTWLDDYRNSNKIQHLKYKQQQHWEKQMMKTYKAPEYLVGSGATIDLFILLISACISCSKDGK